MLLEITSELLSCEDITVTEQYITVTLATIPTSSD